MKKYTFIAVLSAAVMAAALAGCSNSDSSSKEKPVTTTTTTAATEAASAADESSQKPGEYPAEPVDGKPGGKYIITGVKSGSKDVPISPEIDPETQMYLHFNSDGSGVFVSPNGTVQMTWKDGRIYTDAGVNDTFTLEGDVLTVKDGDMTLFYQHESSYSYDKVNGTPEGRYGFVRAYNDGADINYGDTVTAENTYLEFKADGTGTASTLNGTQGFKWSKGKITYDDTSEVTYTLKDDELTIYELTSTIVLKKVQ